jgi:TP53 regulating kinase and related kinases
MATPASQVPLDPASATNTTDEPTPTQSTAPSQPTQSSSQSTDPDLAQLPYPFSIPSTTTPPPQLIAQGAEALLYRTCYLTPSQPAALKVRPSKKYRHRILDERLTKQRVLAEARVLVKLGGVQGKDAEGWSVPAVLGLEWDVGRKVRSWRNGGGGRRVEGEGAVEGEGKEGGKGAWLLMEWIEGKSVKDLVREWDVWWRGEGLSEEEKREGEEELKGLLRRIGRAVAGMHSRGGVVHGDLTSSNMIVRPREIVLGVEERSVEARKGRPDLNGEVVLIDFGLATQAVQDEDRAVDLYVLERAFGSTHPRQEHWFDQEVLQAQEGYKGVYKGAAVVLKRLEEVRLRGRKRSMIG